MRDCLEIGSTPHDEECTPLGAPDYERRGRFECRVLGRQIIRMFGEPPAGANLTVKANPHDFGTYYELAVMYDADNEEAARWAYNVESNSPDKWDATARAELAEGYRTLKESE